jgi:hypothetical protein
MSTKIYNGYCLRGDLSVLELKKFCMEFRKLSEDYLYERYCSLYADVLLSTLESLVVADYGLSHSDIDDRESQHTARINYILATMHRCSNYSPVIFVEKFLSAKDVKFDVNEDVSRFCENYDEQSFLYSWENLIREYIGMKSQIAEASSKNSPYNLYGNFCIIPIEGKNMLLTYGICDDVIQKIFESCDGHGTLYNFTHLYGLKQYMYWNNTDIPDNVTEEEWDLRAKDWEDAIPSGVPADYAFSIDIGDYPSGHFDEYMKLRNDDFKPILNTLSALDLEQVFSEKYYKQYMIDSTAKEQGMSDENSASEWMKFLRESEKAVKDAWDNDRVESIKSEINVPSIDKDFLASSLLDVIPTYLNLRNEGLSGDDTDEEN